MRAGLRAWSTIPMFGRYIRAPCSGWSGLARAAGHASRAEQTVSTPRGGQQHSCAEDVMTMDEEIKDTADEATEAEDSTVEPEIEIEDDIDATDDSAANGAARDSSPLEAVQAELEAAKKEAAGFKDRWLRAVAEHENYKKRAGRDVADQMQREVSRLLGEFLPVADNLDRALESAGDRDDQLVTGIKMVRQVLAQGLEKHGIKAVPGIGAPFDPNHHEALQQFDSPEYAPGHVIQVFEGGYVRDGRLLRPAKVIVAGPGSTGAAPAEGADASTEVSEAEAEEV